MVSLRRLGSTLNLRGRQLILRLRKRQAFENSFLASLPDSLHEPARLLFYQNPTPDEKRTGASIESYRKHISQSGETLRSYSSPHSGTFDKDGNKHAVPGPYAANTAKAHSQTGVSVKGGIFLKRLVTGLGARRVLELGTNTGFSGCYFLSCPELEELVTIEGSQDLCEIADTNLRRISGSYRIMNMLFDDAIDQLIQDGEKFDCAFIDGQHEREATHHYARRVMPLLKPGGAIVFDDIYWSDDMNQCWKELCEWPDFALTVDFQRTGVAFLRDRDEDKLHCDLCEYVGTPTIARKGW